MLLIDEIDRADHEFEAFLLEFLSDFSVSIPERGTIRASEPPVVVLTSNRTRELHEALRRRCVYHWIDYPDPDLEARIVMMRASTVAEETARRVVRAVGALRAEPLAKPPGVAETVEWAEAATLLQRAGRRLAPRLRAGDRRRAEGSGRSGLHRAAPRRPAVGERGMIPRALDPFLAFPQALRAAGFPASPDRTETLPRRRRAARSARHRRHPRAPPTRSTAPAPSGSPSSTRCSTRCFWAAASPRRRRASRRNCPRAMTPARFEEMPAPEEEEPSGGEATAADTALRARAVGR